MHAFDLFDRLATGRLPRQRRSPYDALRTRIAGTVAEPGSPSYDALVASWNLAVALRPAAAVGVRSAHDVVEVVRFARRHRLGVTPQATGHSALEGLVGEVLVATAGLDECVVHAKQGWARVGAGVKWARVVAAAAEHGLAPLCGSSSDVSVVGYTTGGGIGPMASTYGLASDRVRAFEVVTGDGVLRRATPTSEPELFFGLRGGKGALGIVTAVEFDLVQQPRFYGGALWYDGADAADVLERWRTWSAALPERATTSVALVQLPPLPGVPPQLAGRLTVAVRFLWTGPQDEGAQVLADLRGCAPVLLDGVAERPYREVDLVHTDPVDPLPVHEAAALLSALPMGAVGALLDVAGPGSGSPQVIVELRRLGGALAHASRGESAFCQRSAAYSLLCIGVPTVPGTADHAATVLQALRPWATGGMLPNFAPAVDGASACYDQPTLDRLRAAVRTYDPDGVMVIGRALGA